MSSETNNRIVILLQGNNQAQTDAATDQFADFIDEAINQNNIGARVVDGLDISRFANRINSMLWYKDRLIASRSRLRMEESVESQLQWRMDNVTQFPPSNITDPVIDPLGTLEEFLKERIPKLVGVISDGLYLRVMTAKNSSPVNLILMELADGELGNDRAATSIRWLLRAKDAVVSNYDVKLYLSGIPLHATTIKEQTIKEIRWMATLALVVSLSIFLYVTRSPRALLFSSLSILLALSGGLVISHDTVGLPHLVGLIMATTAIGICIDFSFHFWIHIRSGMSGAEAIRIIFPGINMSFVTTMIAFLVISIVSIPVLARTAVFIAGTLLVSWLIVLFVFPKLVGDSNAIKPSNIRYYDLPKPIAVGLLLVILGLSTSGLIFKYYTDDRAFRIGPTADNLAQDDRVVADLLGIVEQKSFYLMVAESSESLLMAEDTLFKSLSSEELSQVEAVSRLVLSRAQQQRNQVLFRRARDNLDSDFMRRYLAILGVSELDWDTSTDGQYSLEWVIDQPWSSIEKNYVLQCDNSVCASMIRALGPVVRKLDYSCQHVAGCRQVSFSERQLSAFGKLRFELAWSLLLAVVAMFITLYFRYRTKHSE